MGKPKAPDMTMANMAAQSQANSAQAMAGLSRDQLEWSKKIYAETAPDRADALRRNNLISDATLESMNTQTAMAKDYDAYNKETFRPLEQSIVADAAAYDTPARREEAAAKGAADVQQSMAQQRGISARDMERSGVAPGSAKYEAMQAQNDLRGTAMQASSANNARTQIETLGSAKRMDAASLGRGLAANQATSAGLALNAAGVAGNSLQAGGNITAQGNQIMTQGFAGAQAGMSNAAAAYGGASGNMRANSVAGMAPPDPIWGVLGTVAGAYVGKK